MAEFAFLKPPSASTSSSPAGSRWARQTAIWRIEAALDRVQAFAQLIRPGTAADLAFLTTTAPRALGAASFAALSNPTPALKAGPATLVATARR